MKTVSGILKLGKREREGLIELYTHTKVDIGFGAGGTFGSGDKCFESQIKKAELGLEVIKFLLKITA